MVSTLMRSWGRLVGDTAEVEDRGESVQKHERTEAHRAHQTKGGSVGVAGVGCVHLQDAKKQQPELHHTATLITLAMARVTTFASLAFVGVLQVGGL